MVGELHLPYAERPAATWRTQPAEVKAHKLPECVNAKATGHHRVALEMASEEPEIGLDVEFGADEALVVGPPGLRDFGDPIKHEHRRQRQLRIAGAKQFPAATGQQVLIFEARTPFDHFRARLCSTPTPSRNRRTRPARCAVSNTSRQRPKGVQRLRQRSFEMIGGVNAPKQLLLDEPVEFLARDPAPGLVAATHADDEARLQLGGHP